MGELVSAALGLSLSRLKGRASSTGYIQVESFHRVYVVKVRV